MDSDNAEDLVERIKDWLEAGVILAWVVGHSSDFTARTLRRTDILDGGEVLPGFSLPIADIFR